MREFLPYRVIGYRLSVRGPPAGAFCIPTRWPAPPRRKDLVVERVGEGDPRARVPDPGARTRLAYEVTVGALHGMYGRLRWGGEDGPASHLAVSGRSSRAGLGHAWRSQQQLPTAGSLVGGCAVFGEH